MRITSLILLMSVLFPAIEGEIHTKLDRLIREAVAGVRESAPNEVVRLLFRGVFRLLAAKILTDREHGWSASWESPRRHGR